MFWSRTLPGIAFSLAILAITAYGPGLVVSGASAVWGLINPRVAQLVSEGDKNLAIDECTERARRRQGKDRYVSYENAPILCACIMTRFIQSMTLVDAASMPADAKKFDDIKAPGLRSKMIEAAQSCWREQPKLGN